MKNRISQGESQGKNKEKILMVFPIAVSVLILALLFINFPLNPKNGTHTTATNIEFGWTGFASKAFIDDNLEFSSPLIIEKNRAVKLEPGEYYWKTEFLSPINSFSVDSKVAVAVEEDENGAGKIRNEGNIAILLEFFRNFVKTGQAVLELDESLELNESNDTKIIASQYGDNKK